MTRPTRKELALAFSMKQMRESFMPHTGQVARDLAASWSRGGSQHIDHDLSAAGFENMLKVAFRLTTLTEGGWHRLALASPPREGRPSVTGDHGGRCC